jgi:hypothetical protein
MVTKKGQITIFIIVAVFLVVSIGIVFVVKNYSKTNVVTPPVGTENVGDFVTNCLKLTSENGLILIGRQGGYYKGSSSNIAYSGNDSEKMQYFTELGSINIPYYWDGTSSSNMPTITTIQNELSNYVKSNISQCLDDFSVFKQKGFTVENGTMEVSARILDEKVVVFLDYPVTITKADFTQKKTVYSVDVPTRLKIFYDLTRDLILNRGDGRIFTLINSGIQLGQAFDTFNRYTLSKSYIIIPSDNTLIFIITDDEYKLNNIYNDWIFAYKY